MISKHDYSTYTYYGCRCEICKAATRAYQVRNKDRIRAREKANYRKWRSWIDEQKMLSGCTDCGYRDRPEALDFDHMAGHEKKFIVAHASGRNRQKVEAEIAKCEVVCANCHRIRTVDRRRAREDG